MIAGSSALSSSFEIRALTTVVALLKSPAMFLLFRVLHRTPQGARRNPLAPSALYLHWVCVAQRSAAIVLLLTPGRGRRVCGGGNEGAPPAADLGEPVAFAEVLSVFEKYGCAGCHPSVMPALDLTAQNAYENLVGVRALLDPTLVRVVAGDPGRASST